MNFLEFLAPFSMAITAVLLVVVNIIEIKQEKDEAKMKEFKDAHDEIKRRWNDAEEK